MAIDDDMEALRKISTTSSCPTESSFGSKTIDFIAKSNMIVYQ